MLPGLSVLSISGPAGQKEAAQAPPGRSWPAGPCMFLCAALILAPSATALCCACRGVLRGRCDHFRARCDSGMRDAEDREVHVPEHFSKASPQQKCGPCNVRECAHDTLDRACTAGARLRQRRSEGKVQAWPVFWLQSDSACWICCLQEVVQTFVQYLYEDTLDVRTEPGHAVVVLHLGHYYGATRLVGLCEGLLAKAFKAGDPEDEGGCAAVANAVSSLLLAMAFKAGCRSARGSSRPCGQAEGRSCGWCSWRFGLHVLQGFSSRACALCAEHVPQGPMQLGHGDRLLWCLSVHLRS